jgi:parallel beta-helix repeat protein
MKRLSMILVMGSVISGGVAHAATYYTSKNGDDGNSCDQAQSPSSTMLTINGALGCLAAGDTLYVGAGTYDEAINDAPSGTSWDNTVRIAANPGDTVWLTPSWAYYVVDFAGWQQYIEFDGINMNGLIAMYGTVKIEGYSDGTTTYNAHHIRISNAEVIFGAATETGVYGNGLIGIMATAMVPGIVGGNQFINLTIHGDGIPASVAYGFYINSSDNLIDSCNIYGVSGVGIHIYSGFGTDPNNNLIQNNTIHDMTRTFLVDNGLFGIVTASGNGNMVYNNTIYNLTLPGYNAGILAYSGSNTAVYNNTIYGTAGWGIIVSASATDIESNTAYENAMGSFIDSGTGTTINNNTF